MIWLWLIIPCAVACLCTGVLASELRRIAEAQERANTLQDDQNALDLENNNLIRDELGALRGERPGNELHALVRRIRDDG